MQLATSRLRFNSLTQLVVEKPTLSPLLSNFLTVSDVADDQLKEQNFGQGRHVSAWMGQAPGEPDHKSHARTVTLYYVHKAFSLVLVLGYADSKSLSKHEIQI